MLRLLASLTVALLGQTAPAQTPREVDIELFLAVDVSRSMSPAELEIQRRGYAQALASDEVIARITGGLIGEIALTYVEWAGVGSQNVVVPWTLIDSPEAARALSDKIASHFGPNLRRTSISDALLYAQASIASNAFTGRSGNRAQGPRGRGVAQSAHLSLLPEWSAIRPAPTGGPDSG